MPDDSFPALPPLDIIPDGLGAPIEMAEGSAHYGDLPASGLQRAGAIFGGATTGFLMRHAERGAYADAGFGDRLLTTMGMGLAGEGGYAVPEPIITPTIEADEANRRYAPPGPDGKPVSITDKPISEGLAQVLGQQKREEMAREGILARPAHSVPVNFLFDSLVSLADPVNASTLFLPAVGEEAILARLGWTGLAGRFGARALGGGAAGAVQMAPIAGLKYGLSRDEFDDYGLRDAFGDIAGGAAGAAIFNSALIGPVREAFHWWKGSAPLAPGVDPQRAAEGMAVATAPGEATRGALAASVAQTVRGEPVDVGGFFYQPPQAETALGRAVPLPETRFGEVPGTSRTTIDINGERTVIEGPTRAPPTQQPPLTIEAPASFAPPAMEPTAQPPAPILPSPAGTAGNAPELRSFAPGDLTVDAGRFQFKTATDAAGVSDRLQGVTQWDSIKSGTGLVWEAGDGTNYIVDGHQRVALAARIAREDPGQAPRIDARVLREADGVTEADARAAAAAKNIAEGTGTALDAAKVLRDRPDLVDTLPPRSELVRQARGLANLAPDAFGKIVNDVVPANYGAIVGRLAPDNPAMQSALVDLLAKSAPDNAVQAESIIRQGLDAGLHTETQATLFGDQQVISSLYAERARILDRALKTLRRDRTVFQSLADNQALIEGIGNRLARDENIRHAATDSQAVQILQTLANRRGPLGDALTAAARSVADRGVEPAAAARDFVAEIRRQSASGDLLRDAASGGGGAVAVAGARPAAAPVAAAGTAEPGGIAGEYTGPRPRPGLRTPEPIEGFKFLDPVIARPASPAQEAAATARVQEAIRAPVTEQTAQGTQLVMPGGERSAVQAMAAREAAGHGLIRAPGEQAPPGGMFAPRPAAAQTLFDAAERQKVLHRDGFAPGISDAELKQAISEMFGARDQGGAAEAAGARAAAPGAEIAAEGEKGAGARPAAAADPILTEAEHAYAALPEEDKAGMLPEERAELDRSALGMREAEDYTAGAAEAAACVAGGATGGET